MLGFLNARKTENDPNMFEIGIVVLFWIFALLILLAVLICDKCIKIGEHLNTILLRKLKGE